MLERAVTLDPTYAPAWVALGRRYYVDSHYGGGTPTGVDRFEAAMARAVSLDPNDVSAAAGLIVNRVERGDLVGADERAEDLVRRRPDSAEAHFALSYVLRFAGLLRESGDHCERALLLDPHTVKSGLRSCAIVFFLRGDSPRAMNYLELDPHSDWAKALSIDILVRQGKEQDVLQIGAPHIPQWPTYDLLVACVERRPKPELLALAQTARPSADPEANYLAAAHLAYCGQSAAALQMVRAAIKGNYCSNAAIESDRLFASLRDAPEFSDIRSAATACQNGFLSERDRLH
jgi:Flp pilus assembly protein TadD